MSGSVGAVMRRAARLKPDTEARQRCEELQKLAAPDGLGHDKSALRVDGMDLKHILGDVEPWGT